MAMGVKHREKEGDKPLPTRYFSGKQESKVAKDLNGIKTVNSGATDFGGKSDVNVANLISVECKTKTKPSDSISIKKDWFDKSKAEAVFDGHKYSVLAFNFGPEEEMHYIIDSDLFIDFVEYLKSINNRNS